MSKEELHAWAISEIESRMEYSKKETVDCIKYYMQGVVRGMIHAYKDCGVISQEEYNKYMET